MRAPEVPPALGWTVLGLVFLDEVLLVAAVWVAGAEAGWVWGLAAAVAVLVAWWTLASPKAPYGGPVVRPLTKALVVAAACGGLWWAGHTGPAVALLVFSILVNGLAQLPSVAALTREAGR